MIALCSLLCAAVLAAPPSHKIPWDIKALSAPPRWVEDPTHGAPADGIRAVFYDGVPWHGKPTRVFAYVGIPKLPPGKKAPAMVLVHGGGGSAFIPWVKLWVDRGYAAISMDTCGCINDGAYSQSHPRDPQGGPPGWGGFDQIHEAIEDQWTYHAVADAVLGHSLLRSLPEVDPDRIGLTGISWGGYLTCIIAGVDPRFKFAAPVYGCGFLGDNSVWLPDFARMGKEDAAKWLGLWDPSAYLGNAKMPMLWVTGTNDFAYPPDSLQKSYRLPKGDRTLCVRVRMPHGHGGAGENPAEILAMADSRLRGGPPLARITRATAQQGVATVSYRGGGTMVRAELNFTRATGKWQDRLWETSPARLDAAKHTAAAEIPADAVVWYINIIDEHGLVVSSEHTGK